MPSPTSRLRLLKQEPGSNFDSWGTQLNTGALDMLDEAFGVAAITVGADVTLDVDNYLTDEARRLVLHLTGAGGFTVTTPAVDKPYLVVNDCAANVTITPSGGTGVTVRAGVASWVWCDGTNGKIVDTTLDKVATAAADVALGGNKLTGVGTATDATDAATLSNRLDQFAAPNASVDMGSQRITGVAAGVDGTDGVNKAQVEAITEPFATAAADSAAAALVSEGNASDSAAAALASEEAAAILFTDFQKRYLGPKAEAPTLDNEGNALEAGALYFDTASGAMNVYDGANWIPIEALALASQAQAEAGTNNDTAMTPLRVAQAIAAQAPGDNVVQAVKTDTASTTSSTFADLGLEVTITLQSADSKVLLSAMMNVGASGGFISADFIILRGSTIVAQAPAAGSRSRAHFTGGPGSDTSTTTAAGEILDTPGAVGPHTYKIQWARGSTSGTVFLNRSNSDLDDARGTRGISTLTATEITP